MNFEEITQLTTQAQAIGLKTMADLAWFKKIKGCKTNNDLLDAVNAAYCEATEVAA